MTNRLWYYAATTACAMLCAAPAIGAIVPGSLLTDNAVLQRDMPDKIWGTADPGEAIAVSIAGQSAGTTADKDGNWLVKLKPMPAGGPYTLSITGAGSDSVTLRNIAVGEVWICGGQSNMEFRLAGAAHSPVAPGSNVDPSDPLLRFVNVAHVVGLTPKATVPGSWSVAAKDTVGDTTAVGYFFARDLRKALKVPIGIVNDNWGGTLAEVWISKEALLANNEFKGLVGYETGYPVRYKQAMDDYSKALDAYTAAKAKYDADSAAAKAAGLPPPAVAPMEPRKPMEFEQNQYLPMHGYNGMIAPVQNYGIRGAIWYQGESNAGHGWAYQRLFRLVIDDWRAKWGEGDFPFLFVQLAPFQAISTTPFPAGMRGWPELREAQRLTVQSCPNTGMAVITDVGDQANIHPKRKEPVGERLALLARSIVYGDRTVHPNGPEFDSVKVEGSGMRVAFKAFGGLKSVEVHDVSDDGPLIACANKLVGFDLAGNDQVYHTADAIIDGNDVVVTSNAVPKPVAVRYGWASYPVANLADAQGLPASPFKSDNWQWASDPTPPPTPVTK